MSNSMPVYYNLKINKTFSYTLSTKVVFIAAFLGIASEEMNVLLLKEKETPLGTMRLHLIENVTAEQSTLVTVRKAVNEHEAGIGIYALYMLSRGSGCKTVNYSHVFLSDTFLQTSLISWVWSQLEQQMCEDVKQSSVGLRTLQDSDSPLSCLFGHETFYLSADCKRF